ncbi:phytoene/squalene synthase family protein [Candidatus Poribacteria bacterium]|nr:phytoene/squalene synthase family protein [Candidatus Poribacteria bacterium]MYH83713.1 phytoene/squalene synthase family protein [Candidatus Poribacteria bacterium]MYK94751.1 phytoene/squalene synthase family protein [Candidatus Poribacteria bacterium]
MKLWKAEENRAAFEYARKITAHSSKSFYFSAQMLPTERRWATFALYGFCRHCDNLIDTPRQRTETEILREIQRLTEELHIAYNTGESQDPIIRTFILVAKAYNIPIAYPLDLLKGVAMDVQQTRYQTFDELSLFCYRVAAVVGLMMTSVLGYKDERAFGYAKQLGIAMQLTNILRDIKEDKEMGRLYIPQTDLTQFGVTEQDIFDEKMTPQLRVLMKFQIERANQYYTEAMPGISLLKTESQYAIYSAAKIYRGILRKIEERDYNPFLSRVFVTSTEKIKILLHEGLRTKVLSAQEKLFPVHSAIIK